jgi:hypothetical protein
LETVEVGQEALDGPRVILDDPDADHSATSDSLS